MADAIIKPPLLGVERSIGQLVNALYAYILIIYSGWLRLHENVLIKGEFPLQNTFGTLWIHQIIAPKV